ncbi:hypothetical protein M9Y10_002915 [Tritrichomonas musculus]|uniref:Uncharacterized protein n=1 Tax=Tritrichomonas musculus TaxID=1915356 RepID=A0ABR2LBX1_9EUKA
MKSRIETSRSRPSSSNSHCNDIRHAGRVPLRQISTNRLQHAQNQKKVLSPANNPAPTQREYVHPEPFVHKEVPIGDIEDPQDIVEFEHVIYRTLRAEENAASALEFNQNEITLKDRDLLIDAICRFHYKLGLMTNTLYRFIGIFDRYLAVGQVPKSKLKLYGCAAFLIASKIEDIYPAQSTDLITLSEKAFTQRELFAAEIHIINAIGFETTFATPLFYLTQFMRINGDPKEIRDVKETREMREIREAKEAREAKIAILFARYILEICQSNGKFYGVKPALEASLAVFVTRIMQGKSNVWPEALEGYTQFTVEDLTPYANIVKGMLMQEDREETKFMRRKYGSDLFLNVAHWEIPSTWI